LANVDCVTVWFFATNWKAITSPSAAVMDDGLYDKLWFAPTKTVCVTAEAAATKAGIIAKDNFIVKIV